MRFLLLLLTTLLSFNFVLAEEIDRPVKIAIITDLSAIGAFWGSQTVLGAERASLEINQGGSKLKLFIYDSKLQAKEAVTLAQKALFIDQVDAIFSDFAAPSIAISELVEQQKKILLYAAAAQSILKTNQYAFKTYLNYEKGCRLLAEKLQTEGVGQVGHLKPISEFGDSCEEGIKQVYPIYPGLISEEFNYGETVETQIKKFHSRKLPAIISAAYADDFENLLRALSRYKYQPKVYTTAEVISKDVWSRFPEYQKLVIGFGSPAASPEFINQTQRLFPEKEITLPFTVLATYVHIKQLYQAISSCPPLNLDCQTKKLEDFQDLEYGFFDFKDREANIPIILEDF